MEASCAKINFRLDGPLHVALMRRARGANLSLSGLVRQLLEQAVDERRRYVLRRGRNPRHAIQILSILATSVGQQSPKALEQGISAGPHHPCRARSAGRGGWPMSIFRNDTLGSWTRGGQAIVHNVRMATRALLSDASGGAGDLDHRHHLVSPLEKSSA
jgi:hypothetical protein